MSLEIDLIEKETGNEVMSLNWLRNPFGLQTWAEDNVGMKIVQRVRGISGREELFEDLRYVCNHWSYEDSSDIDRGLFKQVVDTYWKEIQKLEVGYFVFNLSNKSFKNRMFFI